MTGTSRPFVITVREAPKSVNAGGGGARAPHWSQAHKEKKRWEGLYLMELMAARVPKHMTRCEVDVTIRWKTRNRRDVENYRHPVVKPLLDAMVQGGYLPDDTDEFVRVTDFGFEHPAEWMFSDPRIKAETVIRLEATYGPA